MSLLAENNVSFLNCHYLVSRYMFLSKVKAIELNIEFRARNHEIKHPQWCMGADAVCVGF